MWLKNFFPNLSDRQISIIQLVFTIGLMITILIGVIVMIKYGRLMKLDPCELCEECKNVFQVYT